MSKCINSISFGLSIPFQNPHAVSVSLPLIQNVIDYEEGDENALSKMQSGYPRFFQNSFVKKLVDCIRNKYGISSDKIVLPVASVQAKDILESFVQSSLNYIVEDDNVFLVLENEPEFVKKCEGYIRNSGLLISSRKAEDSLCKLNHITTVFQEDKLYNFPENVIKSVLSKAYSSVSKENILLTNSGMNALFSAYETIVKAREKEGRNTVVQLGWLYVDTMEIIKKGTTSSHLQLNIYNKQQLEVWLEQNHLSVATLITEVTTNPLIQCVDLPWLSSICKKYDIVLIVDVTIATPFNVEVMTHCDIAVESLTKFACGSCDLLMGAVVLNEKSKYVQTYKNDFSDYIIFPFKGELQRLAYKIQQYEERVKKVSENTKILYDYLKNQSFVKEIYSANHPDSIENFSKIRKTVDSFPGLLSVVFDKELNYYYDKLQFLKGPSLGTEFTLAMPYVYLAHYEYLKTDEGVSKLFELGINPNLLRLSIGIEPVEEIISVFEELKSNSLIESNCFIENKS